jgi:hypothetical protein
MRRGESGGVSRWKQIVQRETEGVHDGLRLASGEAMNQCSAVVAFAETEAALAIRMSGASSRVAVTAAAGVLQ